VAKEVRASVRMAKPGADAIQQIVKETDSDQSKVICEILMLAVTTPSIRQSVVKNLKRRKGIEG